MLVLDLLRRVAEKFIVTSSCANPKSLNPAFKFSLLANPHRAYRTTVNQGNRLTVKIVATRLRAYSCKVASP